VPTGLDIKSLVFKGGRKWLTEYYKFDSGSEKDFAESLENDNRTVIHWLRPAKEQFDLQYKFDGQIHQYEPDFVVETNDMCYLVEVKRRSEMNDPMVIAKRDRGVKYCKLASAWCIANHHKPWKYLFIPHDAITSTTSFDSYLEHFIIE
jgi:type III restriction enzyme